MHKYTKSQPDSRQPRENPFLALKHRTRLVFLRGKPFQDLSFARIRFATLSLLSLSFSPRSTPAPTLLFLSPKEICTKEADSFLDILSFLSWIAIRNFKWHLLQTFSRENYYFFFFIYLLTDCINLFSSRRRF